MSEFGACVSRVLFISSMVFRLSDLLFSLICTSNDLVNWFFNVSELFSDIISPYVKEIQKKNFNFDPMICLVLKDLHYLELTHCRSNVPLRLGNV